MKTLLTENFRAFPLGAFPFDPEHSAMGEYHFYPNKGYCGQWFDPICNWNYRGPSWLISNADMDNSRCIEQMRLTEPEPRTSIPTLRSGDVMWKDYTVKAYVRPMIIEHFSGILFRYQTSMMHYGFFLVKDGVELHCVNKLERKVLAQAQVSYEKEAYNLLTVETDGSSIKCYLNNKLVLEVNDTTYENGAIALCSCRPTRFKDIEVTMTDLQYEAYEKDTKAYEEELNKRKGKHIAPKLWKKIDLQNFGASRQIRFGHLTGTEEWFFIICQHQRKVYKDRYPVISCMTAVSIDTGKILWQIGEPCDNEEIEKLTTDLPFQIYDIDNDGIDEVICSFDFKLMILDGRTGEVKKSIPTPLNEADPKTVTGLEFQKYAFNRLNVDAIRIVNVSGNKRPEEILIKDRYSRLWIYDKDLNYKWEFSKYNTGHFPYSYDYNKDGKEEIFSCYNMVDSNGKLQWSLPIDTDHTDEIICGQFGPNQEERIAIVSGWEGFMILSKEGEILLRDINGHGQRISCGNYCPQKEGFEIATTTFWGNNGIIYLHDCNGKEIWHKEMCSNGNVIAPLNWDGNGEELIWFSPYEGAYDGDGYNVLTLPEDGHPNMCTELINLTGDPRDEIVVWDRHWLYIYTQEKDCPKDPRGVYKPYKYPEYNASNYRGEYSFPRWVK
ncbi:MAG: WD40 repeat domain-containing protein [Sphaerochaetaceae bacterium]|nr:WD40 repeat domain-containing protein [Sphaerochaetaceae bacterium]